MKTYDEFFLWLEENSKKQILTWNDYTMQQSLIERSIFRKILHEFIEVYNNELNNKNKL